MCTVDIDWRRLTKDRAVANFCIPAPFVLHILLSILGLWPKSSFTLWFLFCTPALLPADRPPATDRTATMAQTPFALIIRGIGVIRGCKGEDQHRRRAANHGGGTPSQQPHALFSLPKTCANKALNRPMLRVTPPKSDPHGLDSCFRHVMRGEERGASAPRRARGRPPPQIT